MFKTLYIYLKKTVDDYIMIKDFNLYHSLWASLARPTQYAAADILLEIARNVSLELVTEYEAVI
jgi:hypothetical protein